MSPNPLVIFSTQAWSDMWVSKHWIADAFSKTRRVFFVEPPQARGSLKNALAAQATCVQINGSLTVVKTFSLPFPYRIPSLLRPLWRLPLHSALRKVFAGIPGNFDVLNFNPHAMPYLERVRGRIGRLVYYAVDPPLGREDRVWPEARTVRGSDKVAAVTHRLAALLEQESGRAADAVIPHGIDFGPGGRDGTGSVELPPVLSSERSRLVVGYTGAIHDVCVDFDLIIRAAKAKPDWDFVLIGPYSGSALSRKGVDTSRFKALDNVYFCGPMPFAKLRHAIEKFDVCIVPYRADLQSQWERRSPFKLLHYFAQGKPVVMSAVPAADDYGDLVHVYRTADEFLACIEMARHDKPELCQRRIEMAKSRDFARTFEQLRSLVDD